MADFETDIGGGAVSISPGNMVKRKAGAYLVPHFDDNVVFGGFADAIANDEFRRKNPGGVAPPGVKLSEPLRFKTKTEPS